MIRTLVETADGSHTFYIKELKEHYHSIHGAIQESGHVFVDAGFKYMKDRQSLNILEVGFGTGLNALLTTMSALNMGTKVHYTALEAFPLSMKEAGSLNYTEVLDTPNMLPVLKKMHDCSWGDDISICRNFTLKKLRLDLVDFACNKPIYDLVYFDAFAPQIQPELWTEAVFRNLHRGMRKGGVLVTYCAKGSVKRALKAAGFTVEGLPGPPGKREMTRAVKE